MQIYGPSPASNRLHSTYRPEIDGLRAIAVLAVVLNHFDRSILPSGYLGVDVFFVISGFVITSSISGRDVESCLVDYWLSFYGRRFKRLFPALLACIIFGSVAICLVNPEPVASLRTGLSALFGFSNIYLNKQAADYFGSWAEINIFTQTWSLGVEEQFYLIFPLVISLAFSGNPDRKRWGLVTVALSLLIVLSLAFFTVYSKDDRPFAFFSILTRIWELGLGSLIFINRANISRSVRGIGNITALICLIGLPIIFVVSSSNDVPPTIAVVLLTACILHFTSLNSVAYSILTLPVFSYFGKISYSLYLWHWTIICLSRWTVGLSWLMSPIIFGVMLGFSALSYHLIEIRFRRVAWSNSRLKSFFIGAGLLIGAAIFLVVLLGPGHKLLYSGSYLPKTAEPTAQRARGEQRGTILIIGDSHAGHFSRLAAETASQFDLNEQTISFGATAYPTMMISNAVGGLTFARSQAWSQQADREATAAISKIDSSKDNLLILSSFYQFYFGPLLGSRAYSRMKHYDASGHEISAKIALTGWLANLRSFAQSQAKTPIVIILSTPQMPNIYSRELCKKEWFRPVLSQQCEVHVPRRHMLALVEPFNSRVRLVTRDLPNVSVFDPLPALCPATQAQCSSAIDGVRLYNDEDHLSEVGEARVTAEFLRFLNTNAIMVRPGEH